jgi:hypothetical protein
LDGETKNLILWRTTGQLALYAHANGQQINVLQVRCPPLTTGGMSLRLSTISLYSRIGRYPKRATQAALKIKKPQLNQTIESDIGRTRSKSLSSDSQ